jgi:hypothetical protein
LAFYQPPLGSKVTFNWGIWGKPGASELKRYRGESLETMSPQDDVAVVNKRHWEQAVREQCGFTTPWLNLDVNLIRQYADNQLDSVPEPLFQIYPASVLAAVEGKNVLCLAASGGQQSSVFGLLGARVTVVDF